MDNTIENKIETGVRLGFDLGKFIDRIHKEYDMSYVEVVILIESTLNALKQIDPENFILKTIDEAPDKATDS